MGIEQVNQAVALMDEATQQNAALVEEAAAAAESMRDQASSLVKTVSAFKLKAGKQTAFVSEPVLASTVRLAPGRAEPTVSAVRITPSSGRPAAAPVSRPKQAIASATSGGDWEEF